MLLFSAVCNLSILEVEAQIETVGDGTSGSKADLDPIDINTWIYY
jgi:hypothetical protein